MPNPGPRAAWGTGGNVGYECDRCRQQAPCACDGCAGGGHRAAPRGGPRTNGRSPSSFTRWGATARDWRRTSTRRRPGSGRLRPPIAKSRGGSTSQSNQCAACWRPMTGEAQRRETGQAKGQTMSQVTVTINGRQFRMACEDGQEGHLMRLAQDLDQRIEKLRGNFGEIGDARLTIMAALTVVGRAGGRQQPAQARRDRARLACRRRASRRPSTPRRPRRRSRPRSTRRPSGSRA